MSALRLSNTAWPDEFVFIILRYNLFEDDKLTKTFSSLTFYNGSWTIIVNSPNFSAEYSNEYSQFNSVLLNNLNK